MTESTYALTFTIAILLGLAAVLSGKGRSFILTGLAFGVCYLIKPEALGYVGLMIAVHFCVKLIDKKLSIRKVVLNSFFLLAAFLLLSGPYILYIHQQTGTWTISTKLNANLADSQANSRRLTSDGQLTKADILFGGARPEHVVTELSRVAQTPPSNSSRGVIEAIKKLREDLLQRAT